MITQSRIEDDLISRQAALEVVSRYFDLIGLNPDICIDGILSLPTEEPELDEWCTDCKEYDQERHSCPRWNRVIRQTIEDLRAEQRTGEWIPVTERLPERSVEVLTYTEPVGLIEIQSLEKDSNGFGYWENQHGDRQDLVTVTAWMSLPNPISPKSEVML